MSITFAVDDVTPAGAPAATVPLAEWVGHHACLGIDPDLRVLPGRGVHPLLAAVHHAFADHRPLVLSPDAVWLTIAHGVAHHVRLHADTLRSRLVQHAGRRTVTIGRERLPATADEWRTVVDDFRRAIAGEVGAGVTRLLTCDYSTSTEIERTASEIVLLDAFSPYFDYQLTIVCGIPTITLTGTPADWRAIRARIDVIEELDLAFWTRSLVPIADRLVDAAEGRPDVAFFRSIYKPRAAYGTDVVAGWIARLYPYVGGSGEYRTQNPLLALDLDAPLPASNGPYYDGPGITSDRVPPGPSHVTILVDDGAGQRDAITLEGGLLAVEQDPDGRIVPRAGWVIHDSASAVDVLIARLLERGATEAQPRSHDTSDDARRRRLIAALEGRHEGEITWERDATLRRFFEAIEEVTLFEGDRRWHVLPTAQRTSIDVARHESDAVTAVRVVELGDGTSLAIVEVDDGSAVVRVRTDGAPERLDHIRVVGRSLIALLSDALARDGGTPESDGTTLFDLVRRLRDRPVHGAQLLERLRRDHQVVLETGQDWLSDVLHALREGTFRVGADTWAVLPPNRRQRIRIDGHRDPIHVDLAIELPDGTCLGRALLRSGHHVVRIRTDQIVVLEPSSRPSKVGRKPFPSRQPATEIPVVGRSLVEVLEHALDHGGLPPARATLDDLQREADER